MQVNQIIEELNFETEKQYTARPLEHKGFNKHFVNLISADVFTPKNLNFFSMMQNLFFASK